MNLYIMMTQSSRHESRVKYTQFTSSSIQFSLVQDIVLFDKTIESISSKLSPTRSYALITALKVKPFITSSCTLEGYSSPVRSFCPCCCCCCGDSLLLLLLAAAATDAANAAAGGTKATDAGKWHGRDATFFIIYG